MRLEIRSCHGGFFIKPVIAPGYVLDPDTIMVAESISRIVSIITHMQDIENGASYPDNWENLIKAYELRAEPVK